MADKKLDSLIEDISKLSVLELSELVEALQEKFGVSPMAAAAPAAATTPAEDESEAPSDGGATQQTVMLTGAGDKKIAVIKALREINPTLGLKDAKDMTENLPAEVLKDAKSEEAKEAAEKLKTAGATVELK